MIKPALGKCAICNRIVAEKFIPFCSSRCATLDLGRWLGEGYKVPVIEEEPEDGFFIPTQSEDE